MTLTQRHTLGGLTTRAQTSAPSLVPTDVQGSPKKPGRCISRGLDVVGGWWGGVGWGKRGRHIARPPSACCARGGVAGPRRFLELGPKRLTFPTGRRWVGGVRGRGACVTVESGHGLTAWLAHRFGGDRGTFRWQGGALTHPLTHRQQMSIAKCAFLCAFVCPYTLFVCRCTSHTCSTCARA